MDGCPYFVFALAFCVFLAWAAKWLDDLTRD
jgi:hypothetical protein